MQHGKVHEGIHTFYCRGHDFITLYIIGVVIKFKTWHRSAIVSFTYSYITVRL